MFDVLICYGFAANMIRAGYLSLVGDLFRQAWLSCRQFGAAAAAVVRRPALSGTPRPSRTSGMTLRRLARLETYVTSMP